MFRDGLLSTLFSITTTAVSPMMKSTEITSTTTLTPRVIAFCVIAIVCCLDIVVAVGLGFVGGNIYGLVLVALLIGILIDIPAALLALWNFRLSVIAVICGMCIVAGYFVTDFITIHQWPTRRVLMQLTSIIVAKCLLASSLFILRSIRPRTTSL
jgi:hypothetical protein